MRENAFGTVSVVMMASAASSQLALLATAPGSPARMRSTGSGSAESVARDAIGVDLAKPDFWHASLDLVEATLDEFLAASDSDS